MLWASRNGYRLNPGESGIDFKKRITAAWMQAERPGIV
jgi:broad specificity phosphatase PhoE